MQDNIDNIKIKELDYTLKIKNIIEGVLES